MKISFPPAFFILLLYLFSSHVSGQQGPYSQYLDHPWVDSVLAELTMEERMAQTLWINTGPHKDLSHYVKLDLLVREYGIGGLIFKSGTDTRLTELIRHYRTVSKHPLAIASEGDWGGEFPGQPALHAIASDSLLHQLGCRIAQRFSGHGIGVVLAPDIREPIAKGMMEHQMLSIDPEDSSGLAGCIRQVELDDDLDFNHITTLIDKGKSDAESVTKDARRILAFKYWSGLSQEHPPLVQDGRAFSRELYAHALTMLNNEDQLVPIRELEKLRIASLALNACSPTPFQEMTANYTRIDHFSWNPEMMPQDSLLEVLGSYDVVLAAAYPSVDPSGHPSGIPQGMDNFLSRLSERTDLVSTWFGEPEALIGLEGFRSSGGLILAYEQNRFTGELAAQLIFGGIGSRGSLPVAIGDQYPVGYGITTPGGLRLQYGYPENAGLSSLRLNRAIDSIVARGLDAGAYPGCQVIVARKGTVVFHKAYGHHTYEKRIEVRNHDLYDLASVTKISGPLSGLMLLEGMGKFSYQDQLGDYCSAMKGSDKSSLALKDVLTHRAGLYPWIPYHENTLKKNGQYKKRFIRPDEGGKYTLQVADRLYLSNTYKEKIFKEIRKSELGEQKYLYSGLSFFLFPTIIEELSGQPYETFLSENIYHRLGAWELLYQPRSSFPGSQIVPTEYDSLFRKQLVHGYVHDEGAALMGSYAGNAGLFASANDLLKLIEMYRRMGSYGGEQIIPEDVLKEYSSYQFPELEIRRGLGFDKPLLNENDGTPEDYPCPGAPPSSFGHSGFTGTFVWADPENEISYVFLSNRVHTTRNNQLLYEMNIRTAILQSLYDSIIDP